MINDLIRYRLKNRETLIMMALWALFSGALWASYVSLNETHLQSEQNQTSMDNPDSLHAAKPKEPMIPLLAPLESTAVFTIDEKQPFRLDRYADFFSTSEYLQKSSFDDGTLHRFATSNLIRGVYQRLALEAGIFLLNARERSPLSAPQAFQTDDLSFTRLSLSAGLYDPAILRALVTLNISSYRHERAIGLPDSLPQVHESEFLGLTLSAQKTFLFKARKLDARLRLHLDNSESGGFDPPDQNFVNATFSQYDYDWVAQGLFSAFVYATDILDEPLVPHTDTGFVRAEHPLLYVNRDAYLTGTRLHILKQSSSDSDGAGSAPNINPSGIEINLLAYKNAGSVMGFDLDYTYKSIKNDPSGNTQSTSNLRCSLRLTLIDDPLFRLITLIEYGNRLDRGIPDSGRFDDLSGAACVVSRPSKHVLLSAFAKYNSIWKVRSDFFGIEPLDFHVGATIGLEY